MYASVFFGHILGVLALFSGLAIAGTAFSAARGRDTARDVALLLGLSRIGVLLVAGGTLLAGLCGLWLVHLGRWGYGSGWVDASFALFAAALTLGGLGGRTPRQARVLAVTLAAQSEAVTPELRALLEHRATRWTNTVAFALMVAIVADMCFKP
ncbi:DUF2269 family protein [Conexibacter sp. DBS9H8]|uniref:DUF2269 family protein n=1 Tax=Conexibacter sp. DBS9H8 TaxID=2937801 RepID=UPI00200EEA2F|nr:DUF2269 family protein [Conexibacter sp. DBS9H8]